MHHRLVCPHTTCVPYIKTPVIKCMETSARYAGFNLQTDFESNTLNHLDLYDIIAILLRNKLYYGIIRYIFMISCDYGND